MKHKIMKIRIYFWMVLLALAASAAVFADQPALKVGDPAPKLQMGKWIQGDPVAGFDRGKAYIVEFWATWCVPCRASMPHLNGIYLKFKDKGLVVIGQDCWEQDDDLVAPFVKKMGDKMTYRVALDDKKTDAKGVMAKTWMAAAGRDGIPSAFLVDTKGVVAWIGNPMELDEHEDMINQVLAGKLDIQRAAADYDKDLKAQTEQEKQMALARPKIMAMTEAMREKKWDEALDDLAAAEKLTAENHRHAFFEMDRFTILLRKKDYSAAYKLAAKISDASKGEALMQNRLARQIVNDNTVDRSGLDLAETLVSRANEASKGDNPEVLNTQARLLFLKGQKEAAVQVETKAVALAETDRKQSMQSALDSYKKGELPEGN
jgi:thiol-disulfide isomerase/thioredoxin